MLAGTLDNYKTSCMDPSYNIWYSSDRVKNSHAFNMLCSVSATQEGIQTDGPVTGAFIMYNEFYHLQLWRLHSQLR